MAGPHVDNVFPLVCPVSGDDICWVTPVHRISKLVHALETPDSGTMMKQLYYLRHLMIQETENRSGRCALGSYPAETAYIWFPLSLEHAPGVLTIAFFERLIEAYKAMLSGDTESAKEISRDLLR